MCWVRDPHVQTRGVLAPHRAWGSRMGPLCTCELQEVTWFCGLGTGRRPFTLSSIPGPWLFFNFETGFPYVTEVTCAGLQLEILLPQPP